jgi:hypothetical protein
MPDVRYVILSDLHFGAENSVLTAVTPDLIVADPTQNAPVLLALVKCLRHLVRKNEGARRPTLVLGGDMLELALALDNVAAMVFEHFVGLTLVGRDPLFAPTIYFVPGNHDHHLWEGARERRYAEYVASVPRSRPLAGPRHTTPMFVDRDETPVEAQLLSALVRRVARPTTGRGVGARKDPLRVQTVYPNLAFLSDDGRRGLVFHHGHYVESIYRLMSLLNEMIFERPTAPDIEQWEAENFAWVDFFWSTLGRSGDVGVDVATIYQSLQSPGAIHDLVRDLSRGVSTHVRGPVRRRISRTLLHGILDLVVKHVAASERRSTQAPLTPDATKGLRDYLEGPLRNQLNRECNGDPPVDLTFAFGHTHKPFIDTLVLPGYPAPVHIMNTGGWVVDSLHPEPLHGAAAVLLDEHLNSVMLRFYAQRASAAEYRVEVLTAPGTAPTKFEQRIRSIVQADQPPWADFSAEIARVVVERNQDLATIIDRPSRPVGT